MIQGLFFITPLYICLFKEIINLGDMYYFSDTGYKTFCSFIELYLFQEMRHKMLF